MERKYPRQDKIINLLHERHLSRREFAEQIGMTESGLSGRLTGRVKLKPYQAKKIAAALNVPVKELFVGVVE